MNTKHTKRLAGISQYSKAASSDPRNTRYNLLCGVEIPIDSDEPKIIFYRVDVSHPRVTKFCDRFNWKIGQLAQKI